jgi:hypothetical protein
VTDPKHRRVLLYVSNSDTFPAYDPDPNFGNQCSERYGKFQIIEVSLDAPERGRVIRDVKLGPASGPPVANSCHDIGVLMNGHRQLAVCAGEVATVHDISNSAKPVFVTSFTTAGVSSWHSAALSWDGRVAVMGWEPGGGVEPECEAGDPSSTRTCSSSIPSPASCSAPGCCPDPSQRSRTAPSTTTTSSPPASETCW